MRPIYASINFCNNENKRRRRRTRISNITMGFLSFLTIPITAKQRLYVAVEKKPGTDRPATGPEQTTQKKACNKWSRRNKNKNKIAAANKNAANNISIDSIKAIKFNQDDLSVAADVFDAADASPFLSGVIDKDVNMARNVLHFGARTSTKPATLGSKERSFWKQLVHTPDGGNLPGILASLALLTSAVYTIIFAIPLALSYSGWKENFGFLLFHLTYYELLSWFSWLGTVKFIQPNYRLTGEKRIFALFCALITQKHKDFSWIGKFSHLIAAFPIPFCFASTGVLPFGCMLIMIMVLLWGYHIVQRLKGKAISRGAKEKAKETVLLLINIATTLAIAFIWGMYLYHYRDQPRYQLLVSLTQPLLRFFCKHVMVSRRTVFLSPQRFMILNLIPDLFFIRAQVLTTPFIRNRWHFAVIVLGEFLNFVQATFFVGERLGLLATIIFLNNRKMAKHVKMEFPGGIIDRIKGLFQAPIAKISHIYVRGQNNKIQAACYWTDRALYIFADAIAVSSLSIIVRINHLVTIMVLREHVEGHLTEPFKLSDKEWRQAIIFGWSAVLFLAIGVWKVAVKRIHVCNILDSKKKTIFAVPVENVIRYVFQEHYWFWFSWIVTTGAYSVAGMIQHFGFDFTMEFEWLHDRRMMY